jgi:Tol biopolymer transport system component
MANLWLLDTTSGALREVKPEVPANPKRGPKDFAWSPDGTELVLIAGYEGTCRIEDEGGSPTCTSFLYRMQADGSNLRKLTSVEQRSSTQLLWIR